MGSCLAVVVAGTVLAMGSVTCFAVVVVMVLGVVHQERNLLEGRSVGEDHIAGMVLREKDLLRRDWVQDLGVFVGVDLIGHR